MVLNTTVLEVTGEGTCKKTKHRQQQGNKQKAGIQVLFELTKPQRQLFKGWIALSSEQITTAWIGNGKT